DDQSCHFAARAGGRPRAQGHGTAARAGDCTKPEWRPATPEKQGKDCRTGRDVRYWKTESSSGTSCAGGRGGIEVAHEPGRVVAPRRFVRGPDGGRANQS